MPVILISSNKFSYFVNSFFKNNECICIYKLQFHLILLIITNFIKIIISLTLLIKINLQLIFPKNKLTISEN